MTEIFINNFNAISDELLNIEGTMYSVRFDISIEKILKATRIQRSLEGGHFLRKFRC